MKRWVVLLLAVAMLLGLATTAFAQTVAEKEDSLTVRQEVKQELGLDADAMVLHFYKFQTAEAFSKNGDIDEIFSNCKVSNYYVVEVNTEMPTGIHTDYQIHLQTDSGFELLGKPMDLKHISRLYETEALQIIASDIVVYNTYAFCDKIDTMPTIYYETSKGDFVYFTEDSERYLMPVNAYCKLKTAIYEDKQEMVLGKHYDYSKYTDPYNIDSEDFYLNKKPVSVFVWIGIGLGICCVAVGTVIGIKLHKKSKR